MIRWLLALLLLAVALVAAAYFFSVPIVRHVATDLAWQQGVALTELEFERPGLHGIRIERLVAVRDNIHVAARGIDVAYNLEHVLARPLDEMRVNDLQVEVRAHVDTSQSGEQPADTSGATDFAALFGIVPRVEVQALLLRVAEPEFVGTGSFRLDGDTATFELSGREPEIARNFQLEGQLQADRSLQFAFFDRDRVDAPFLELAARFGDAGIDARAQFDLMGYPLGLVAGLAGLPQGVGRVQGHVSSVLENLDAAVAYQDQPLTGTYVIDWQDETVRVESLRGTLDGSLAAMQLSLDGGGVLLPQLGSRFTVGSGTQVQYAQDHIKVGSGLTVAVLLEEIELHSMIRQTEIDLQGPVVETAADFSLSAYGLQTSGTVTGELTMTGDDLGAELVVSLADAQLPFSIDYSMVAERGTLTGAGEVSGEDLLAGFVDQWPYDFDIAAGELGFNVQALIADDKVSGTAQIDLSSASVRYEDYVFSGTEATLDFAFAEGDVQLRPSEITVARFDPGVPLENLEGLVAWHNDVVQLQAGQLRALGGTVTLAPMQYDLARGKADVDVTLTGLDLAEVLALEGDDIKGTGRLYGTLPLKVDNGVVSMTNGRIHAGEGGGRIELSPELGVATGQPGIDFALQALADFTYETLTAVAEYQENGDLTLGVSLQGNNPAVEKGRPIHYNLNINENVFDLIEALNAQRGVTDQVERRVRDQQGS